MWLVISLIMMGIMGYRLASGFRRGRMLGWMNIPMDRAADKFGFWEYVILYTAFFGGFFWLAIHILLNGEL